MRSFLQTRGFFPVMALFAMGVIHTPVRAQQPAPKIMVKFKVFDTNVPTKQLTPVLTAQVFVRDPVTKKQVFQESVDVEPPKDKSKGGFYELKVFKGWLIEQLVIDVDDPVKDYNPAFVTKVVSAADMTIYPGASKSTDPFSFQAYIAQLSAYRALLSQLLDEAISQNEKERLRTLLRRIFKGRLLNMADINKRLLSPKKGEFSSAQKLMNDVLQLYGLPYSDQPEPLACCDDEATSASIAATIIVSTPTNAKLFVDGVRRGRFKTVVTPCG